MSEQTLDMVAKMAHFKGLTRKEFIDEAAAHGNIFELLECGMLFIQL